MGAGKNSRNTSSDYGAEYQSFLNRTDDSDWFESDDNTNDLDWWKRLTVREVEAIERYTDDFYIDINQALYSDDTMQDIRITQPKVYRDINLIENVLNQYELKQGIVVERACGTQLFGKKDMTLSEIRDVLNDTGGVIQSDGFLSFTTLKDGLPIEDAGVIIHLKVPPSKGAGAYIESLTVNGGEKEFLLNYKSLMHFDKNSMYYDKDTEAIHITAEWLGRADKRVSEST